MSTLLRLEPGKSYTLTPGRYAIDPSIEQPGRQYYGGQIVAAAAGVVIDASQRLYVRRDGGPEDVTLKGLHFDGTLLYSDQANGGMMENVTVDDCEFIAGAKISWTAGLRNSRISDCLFQDVEQAIYGYNYDGLTICWNDFINCRQQAHIDALIQSRNLVWRENFATGWSGIGLELQTKADGVIIEDNMWDAPRVIVPKDLATISAILDDSINVGIRRNWFPNAPQDVWHIEAGGGTELLNATVIEDNYVQQAANFVRVTDKRGTWYVIVRKNRLTGAWPISADNAMGTLVNQENGPSVNLSWEINRPRPGRHRRLDPPQPTPPPDDELARLKLQNAALTAANAKLSGDNAALNQKLLTGLSRANGTVLMAQQTVEALK